MNEDKIKEAFQKAKQDIAALSIQLEHLKYEIQELKQLSKQTNQQTDNTTHSPTQNPAQKPQISTIQHINPTFNALPTENPTDNLPFKAIKTTNTLISTGNEGVPTNKQTNQQTDNTTRNEGVKVRLNQEIAQKINKLEHLTKVTELLNSLDDIKKELRQKLKKLTNQEMAVFATIYQLEQEGFIVAYHLMAQKLSLTETSIRDYTQRLIRKGLPLIKIKENNKKVLLSLSPELKKIASLSTLIELREI